MTPRLAIGLLCASLLALPQARRASPSAEALLGSLRATTGTSAFRVWATLTHTAGSGRPDARQIVVLGRRGPRETTLLITQAWPEVRGGRAVVVSNAGGRLGGFSYDGARVTPFTASSDTLPLFESDVTMADVAQTYLAWPGPLAAGSESVREYVCTILDLRPPARTRAAYGHVRLWVSPELELPLRAELYGPDGRLLKRVGLYRELRIRDRWVAGIVTIEAADGRSRTVVEGSKYELLDRVPADAFTPAGVRRTLARSR